MERNHTLIAEAYAAFNRRDIKGALALMSENIDWPRASESGRVVGKAEIHAYWTRQWAEFDPHVEPLEMTDTEPGKTNVRAYQVVRNLQGDVLAEQTLVHVFTIANDLIERMDIPAMEESRAAFGHAAAT